MNKKVIIINVSTVVLLGATMGAFIYFRHKSRYKRYKESEFNKLKNALSNKAIAGLTPEILTNNKSQFIESTPLNDIRFLTKSVKNIDSISEDDKQKVIRIVNNSGIVK